MALQKETWIQDIQENLYANNTFLGLVGLDDSQYVNYLTVHLPQAGANPAVSKNRSSFPATIAQRTDADLTYQLAQYTTDPVLVTKLDEIQVSYDKRMSVMGQHIKRLSNVIANNTLYSWAPSSANSRLVRCSGTAGAGSLAPSATGTRNAMTLADIQAAVAKLDNDNVDPNDDRYIIMPASMYWNDFMGISSIQKYLEYGSANLPGGKVPSILGLKIIVRSSVFVYDTTAAIKAVDATGTPSSPAATDNNACLVVSSSYVRKALGTIDVFSAIERPEYYGDIFSALVMQGAAIARTNQEGVVAIVQQ